MNMKYANLRICVATTVHYAFDTRIYFKQVRSLSKRFIVDYYSQGCSDGKPEPSGKFISLPRSDTKFGRIKVNFGLFKLLWISKYDIYHFHDPELILLGLFLKLKKKQVIFDMHEDISRQIENKEWIPKLIRSPLTYIFSKLENYLPKAFDFVLLAEDSYLEKYGGIENCAVIHNYPVKQQNQKKDYKLNSLKLVYVGDIRRIRGIIEYLRLLKKARDSNLGLRLILIGRFADESIKKECFDFINMNSLKKLVTYYNRLPNDRIYDIIRQCDLGLALLHPIPNYVSSYPTKLFEYMSVGLPVLASNFELWNKIVKHNDCGYTVNPFDISEAFKFIEKYFHNANLLKKHGENGINLITDKFNWEREAEHLFKVYNDLTSIRNNRKGV